MNMNLIGNKPVETKSYTSYRQVIATLSVSYLCISCGNFLGFTSTAIPSMKNDLETFPELNNHNISWIGSLGPLGALLGALFTIIPIGRLGSRRTIGYFGAPAMLLSWTTIGLSKSLYTVYLGRFLGGFASGIIIPCTPLYVIDVSSVIRRGKLGILPQFLMIFGILLSYILGTFLEWRSLAIACTIIASPCLILLPSAPDSPKWLVSRKQQDKAHKILENLQGPSEALSSLQLILEKVNTERIFREKQPRVTAGALKSFAVVLGIMTFQQLTGINGVTFYSVNIFRESAGVSVWGAHIPSIILASVQCCASFTSSFIIERAGRKPLLLTSATVLSIAATVLASYFYFGVEHHVMFWVPLAALIVFVLGFGIGFGPITWILCAELLAEETRHIMNPLAIAYNWFCVFLVTKSFPLLLYEINIYGIFLVYAFFAALGIIFIALFVPETKGKTLSEIRKYFGNESITSSISDDCESNCSPLDSNQKCLEEF